MNANVINDASVYQLNCKEFLTPVHRKQLVESVKKALLESRAITMRAGGTSLGGQAIGSGVVLDISKHLTSILDYRPDEKEVDVEPGVIQDDLNDFVKADGLRFAPDTSTSNRAMIGGMIGNNSCGSYSVYYGSTREHVKSVEVILADGSVTEFAGLSESQLADKLALQTFEGNIYRTVFSLLERHGKHILDNYPCQTVKRRNTGYALDEIYRHHQPFNPKGKPFSLAPLMCGSEGTLAVVTKATLNLVDLPKHRQLICAHFDSVEVAMRVVDHLLAFKPAAIELIDKPTLDGTKANIQQQQNRFWIEGEPQAVLVCEWFSDCDDKLNQELEEYQAWLLNHGSYAAPIIEPENMTKVWEVRKAGLGMLMGKVTRKKAVAVIEDGAVPIHQLYNYYCDVQAMMKELAVGCVYYGHASVGLIHIRPEIDLATAEGRALFTTIAERNSKLIKKYRGAISGEHGDGRIRAPFLKEQVGSDVYAYLLELKKAFDPHNLFNPGVIISEASITENLRADRQPIELLKPGFDWQTDISLMNAVEKCNGAAACRKSAGRGTMCPSYQATREENYSTRGRSNLLRYALTEPEPLKALNSAELKDALEMCLGCKACRSECPANVDMARLKSEVFFQIKTKKLLPSLADLAIKHYGKLLSFGQKWPNLFNSVQSLSAVKYLLGVDSRRALPLAHKEGLAGWWQKSERLFAQANVPETVWVLCDLFSQYQEPKVGKATLATLAKAGFNVKPVYLTSSARALISSGQLSEAKKELLKQVRLLKDWQQGDFIVGIEPSELLVWRDEAKSLLEAGIEKSQQPILRALQNILSYEEFVLQQQSKIQKLDLLNKDQKIWLHVHCHQKSLAKPLDVKAALQVLPGSKVNMVNSGCCGMSGDFGYKHFEVSQKIANQILLPALQNAKSEDVVVATGTSCRHQLKDLASYNALHVAQVYAQAMGLEL